MANDLTKVIPTIFAQGLMALRENCVMPRLVNSDYSADAKAKGNTVDIPIPSAVAVVDVAPAAYAPDPGNAAPTTAKIDLDFWREAPFYMTDADLAKSLAGVVPMQVTEAVRALSNDVNSKLFALVKKLYGYTGTAGTTPFSSDVTDATQARKILNQQLSPLAPRYMVLDPDAEAKALALRAFQDASFRGDTAGLMEGQIGRKFGFDFFADQQVPTHTAGTAAGATTDNAGYAVGVKTITLASAGTGTILVGDILTFAGDSQTYVVTSGDGAVGGGGTVSFEPGLKVAIPTATTAITLKASHVMNVAFHRDCFGFASRLLEDSVLSEADRQNMMMVADPVSKLTLRLEVRREHKRTRWSFDLLYGCNVVRPEFGTRVAG